MPFVWLRVRRFLLVGLLLLPTGLAGQEPAAEAPDVSLADTLRIHFLDVGQGDAILVEVPPGRTLLIDAGGDGRVVDHLLRLGVDTIDLLIASHNHADHIGGMVPVLRALPVRFFMDNGVAHTTATYRGLLETLLELDVPLLEAEGRTIELGLALLEILPPPGDGALGHNDNSIGLVLRFGEFRASFAGDAESALWRHWLEEIPDALPRVQLHKASHHGSRNGDTRAALERLGPRLVVVSASGNNPYGHPHPEALELYAGAGADVLLTADEGTIIVAATMDGAFQIRTRSPASVH